jgi:hypothetical protein
LKRIVIKAEERKHEFPARLRGGSSLLLAIEEVQRVSSDSSTQKVEPVLLSAFERFDMLLVYIIRK